MHYEVRDTKTGSVRWSFARRAMAATLPFVLALTVPGMAGCTPHNPEATDKATGAASVGNEPVMLAITGYNYTNQHIESFSVNGQGGGNVFVSTATSGGGGSVCCIRYRPGRPVTKVKVRWQSGGCYYQERSPASKEVYDMVYPYFKEREVVVDSDIPVDPQVLEIHFYPDGSLKAAISAGVSLPRLRLDPAREDKSDYPRCPNEKKPQQ